MANNTTNKNDSTVLSFKKKGQFNIGIFLFGIIFLYLVVMIVLYLTANRTTSYEVRIGNIFNDTTYTGIAVREEQIVNAEQAGYVNYYSSENAKVKVGSKIYTTSANEISPEPDRSADDGNEEKKLTNDQQISLGMLVHSFTDSFSDEMFSEVYSFKDSVQNSISDISSANKANYLDELLSKGDMLLSRSADDGIIVYSSDGYESLKKEEVTISTFDKTKYHTNEFHDNMKVSAGDPVYKLVTSENWSVVVPVSEQTAEALKERKSVKVRFSKDKETLTAKLTIENKDGQYLAYLNFTNSMIRYAGDRFLDVELILEEETGLKIPKSSLTQKPFYIVPMEYLTQGGNSNEKGVLKKALKKNGDEITDFIPVTVYYTENDMAYLDPKVLSDGDVLLKPESNMTYIVGEQRKLSGVFNINKGYAVFKHIKILCESDDYYIVESGNDYGLANYDHIALDSKSVKENDIITQ